MEDALGGCIAAAVGIIVVVWIVVAALVFVYTVALLFFSNVVVAADKLFGCWPFGQPVISWAVAGFLLGFLVYFALCEAGRLNRPGLQGLILLFAGSLAFVPAFAFNNSWSTGRRPSLEPSRPQTTYTRLAPAPAPAPAPAAPVASRKPAPAPAPMPTATRQAQVASPLPAQAQAPTEPSVTQVDSMLIECPARVREGIPFTVRIRARNTASSDRIGTIAASFEGGNPSIPARQGVYDVIAPGSGRKITLFEKGDSGYAPRKDGYYPDHALVELYSDKWTGNGEKTLEFQATLPSSGRVTLLVRTTFARREQGRVKVEENVPSYGQNDQQGLPCKDWDIEVTK